ncbi:MAG: thiamine biosynthesis protein ThiS [Ferrovum sp. 37-45-19]|jgi:thiamine biosynthesis protein ThiS|uniref:sulfur carrier protein ThiS n=1 Tax=Ferrovum sp. JA12 TaxID=1356299 RepID=UPI000702CDED|nr:sulfur carrier protein ThiS [Ferrovum sp. JA12]OYV79600.1 MAG: thiamine biosynthesis protein ThiS [Ferrovum sp. 21-44-67]OYV94605.1 MAG: thiamine biosynthesis protein ThiS [Ferrovum sp. 37-45-19]OZB34568.1 MAG: thiamine biosynthesis protein ThiS [Ferrovum sp. 34-44-207]HQT81524.1 sulfur carrier protein ThiS [Ferrovaceae bacterium]KRH79496.1 sulfur carrier protein ThiS [Ferrovum sp. JA12]
MNIIVNGDTISVEPNTSLSKVIHNLNIKNQRFAVEVNGLIITRSDYDFYHLKENDKVEIVIAVGGG